MTTIKPLMRRNFLEYASYVVVDRAIPDIRDGCKPVQRRILHTLSTMDDGKFQKVANVAGECMKLHPHGTAAIEDALVVLANKGYSPGVDHLGYLIEKQGNYGNRFTGDGAAASRYIECRLSPLAKETLFNPDLTAFVKSYDGRRDEPESLPSKLPLTLLLGTEGIAVGMATSILPHNLGELLQAQIRCLRGEAYRGLRPDFATGGIMDASGYEDGRGSVTVRARIEPDGERRVVIHEIPATTTVDSLIASIEAAVEKGKVKIGSIRDKTGEEVLIELDLPRGVAADEVIPQLYAFTDCEVKIASNLTVIRDRKPAELTVRQVLEDGCVRLTAIIKAELEHELGRLTDKRHWLTLEQLFIEHRIYKRIEAQTTEEGVRQAVWKGMEPHAGLFVRPMAEADVDRLLEIRIKRISQYDIDRNRRDIDAIVAAIAQARAKLKDLVGTTVAWIEGIHERYAKLFPRRTRVRAMEEIDAKAVARANLTVAYDPETGFWGTSVRGGEHAIKCSEYDRVIIITADGVYRILAPEDKVLIEGKVVHVALFDQAKGLDLTLLYRDGDGCAWAKKTTISSFIKGRAYELIKDRDGKIDKLLPGVLATATGICHLRPFKGQRVSEVGFDLAAVEPCGTGARGVRLTDKAVQRIELKG